METKRVVKIHNPAGLSKPAGYSHVAEVKGGKLVYVAGQVAFNQSGNLIGGAGFAEQVEQVFHNLKIALEAAGGSFEDVVKLNYFCVDRVDRGELPKLRAIRDRFVNTKTPPASTFVFVSDLVRPEWLIEIEAIAAV